MPRMLRSARSADRSRGTEPSGQVVPGTAGPGGPPEQPAGIMAGVEPSGHVVPGCAGPAGPPGHPAGGPVCAEAGVTSNTKTGGLTAPSAVAPTTSPAPDS